MNCALLTFGLIFLGLLTGAVVEEPTPMDAINLNAVSSPTAVSALCALSAPYYDEAKSFY